MPKSPSNDSPTNGHVVPEKVTRVLGEPEHPEDLVPHRTFAAEMDAALKAVDPELFGSLEVERVYFQERLTLTVYRTGRHSPVMRIVAVYDAGKSKPDSNDLWYDQLTLPLYFVASGLLASAVGDLTRG